MRIDIDCKQMARLISDSLDRPMPPAERTRMRLHMVLCETCRNVDEQMGFLRRTMQQLGREQALEPGRTPKTSDPAAK
jgi:hypothetical protein